MKEYPFIPAKDLKQQFQVFGHFYSVELVSGELVECRSVLEIATDDCFASDHNELCTHRPDAVFIMMNPGSSKPLVDVSQRIAADAIDRLHVSLVPTRPDTTQYQVMRLMHFLQWRHVRVLNLSDLRCSKSPEFIRQFERLEAEAQFLSHSIFADDRTDELAIKLRRRQRAPVVLAWGVSDRLTPLADRCLARLPRRSRTAGLLEDGSVSRYRHPLPSLQKQQRQWINEMLQQFKQDAVNR